MLLDKAGCRLGIALGQVALVYRGSDGDVAVGIQRKRLHVVAVVRAEVAVKAHIVGQRGAAVAEVPLAHHAGGVTRGLEQVRQRDLLRRQAHMAVGIEQRMEDIVPDAAGGEDQVGQPRPRRQAAGEIAGAGGRAHRGGGIEIREYDAVCGQLVDIGRGNHRAARGAGTQVAVAQVIEEDEDNIRPASAGNVPELADLCEVVVFALQRWRIIRLSGGGQAIAEEQREQHCQQQQCAERGGDPVP